MLATKIGSILVVTSNNPLSFRQSYVTCTLSFEMSQNQLDLAVFPLLKLAIELINSLPIVKTLPATVFTLSQIFNFYQNSPLISANSYELSNRKSLRWGETRSFQLIKRDSMYFFKPLILASEQSFPSILREAQKFFSGSIGMIWPGQFSNNCCCKNQKSLNRLLTSVLFFPDLVLERMVYNLQLVMQPSDMVSIQLSIWISLPSRNLIYCRWSSLLIMSSRLVLWESCMLNSKSSKDWFWVFVILISLRMGLGIYFSWYSSASYRRLISLVRVSKVGQSLPIVDSLVSSGECFSMGSSKYSCSSIQQSSIRIIIQQAIELLYCQFLNSMASSIIIHRNQCATLAKLQFIQIMNWYSGVPVERPIDKLIDSGITKVQQLFEDPDFFSELKAFNPKLLEFLTSNQSIVQQALSFVTEMPSEEDSPERKYKYPMLATQMVETQTVSILNAFFKPSAQGGVVIDHLFGILDQKEMAPILAGYFIRIIGILMKLRCKETLDQVYSKPEILRKLVRHSYNTSAILALQVFLFLDSSKLDRIIQGKEQVKKQVIQLLMKELMQTKSMESASNISYLLISFIDGYYLISDSKSMMETLLTQEFSEFLFETALKESREEAMTLLLKSILRYYIFSSHNIQEKETPEFNAQNMDRLEKQFFIISLCKYFSPILEKAISTESALHKYSLIELLCHTVQLNSNVMYELIRSTQFFKRLIELIYRDSEVNIIHNSINRMIQLVFSNERSFYEKYQQHLFCEVDIISLTIPKLETETMKTITDKSYFGYLIKIIKNYSKIQTNNSKIYEVIEKYKDLWAKAANGIIKSYSEASQKELGTYDIQDSQPLQYKETKISVTTTQSPIMMNVGQLNVEEANTFRNMNTSYPQSGRLSLENNLFQLPIDIQPPEQRTEKMESIQDIAPPSLDPIVTKITKIPLTIEISETQPKVREHGKSPSWQQYKKSASKLAEQKIQLQKRSISQDKERRLTPNRGKSPSAAMKVKKQSWGSSNDQKQEKQEKTEDKTAITESKIPAAPKNPISSSMILTKQPIQKLPMLTKSMGNLNDLKSIKVRFVPSSKTSDSKKFRKVQPKDLPFLNFLGIKVSK